MKFDWDARKAAANRRKDGVSFEEASEVFGDAWKSFKFWLGAYTRGELLTLEDFAKSKQPASKTRRVRK